MTDHPRGPVRLDLTAAALHTHPGALIVGEFGSGQTDEAAMQTYLDERRDTRRQP